MAQIFDFEYAKPLAFNKVFGTTNTTTRISHQPTAGEIWVLFQAKRQGTNFAVNLFNGTTRRSVYSGPGAVLLAVVYDNSVFVEIEGVDATATNTCMYSARIK